MIRNEPVIRTILDNAGIRAGVDVLDVACGTGVLFPDYLARDVHSVTGVDISPEMARRRRKKFPDARVTVLCGDIETVPLPQPFDCCMVYNAFPHFPDPARLIAHLATLLKTGGRLSIAHGMSRAMLDRHHAGSASTVSVSLMSETELAALMAPYFDVDVVISDDRMYQVCGTKKKRIPSPFFPKSAKCPRTDVRGHCKTLIDQAFDAHFIRGGHFAPSSSPLLCRIAPQRRFYEQKMPPDTCPGALLMISFLLIFFLSFRLALMQPRSR